MNIVDVAFEVSLIPNRPRVSLVAARKAST
jgi:hypothetical protein